MFQWGNFAVGKNFRGEPGKVEKAVLKSLMLKILVLNHHVPVLYMCINTGEDNNLNNSRIIDMLDR